jgi:hypothetical protein
MEDANYPVNDDDPTAQDVIDAMRIVVMAQDDPAKACAVLKCLLDHAPDTMNSRGINLLLELIAEASLKVELA